MAMKPRRSSKHGKALYGKPPKKAKKSKEAKPLIEKGARHA